MKIDMGTRKKIVALYTQGIGEMEIREKAGVGLDVINIVLVSASLKPEFCPLPVPPPVLVPAAEKQISDLTASGKYNPEELPYITGYSMDYILSVLSNQTEDSEPEQLSFFFHHGQKE